MTLFWRTLESWVQEKDGSPCGIKAVLFDLDGVLVDSFYAWFHQFQDVLRHFGFEPISEAVFRHHWGRSTKDDVNTFMPGVGVEAVRKYFHDHYDEYMPYLKITPHAHEVLQELKHLQLRLGCVTNSHQKIVRCILAYLHMDESFDAVITADDVRRPKPAPDMIIQICKRLNVTPKHTVFIGDTETDTRAGIAAGCRVIGYRRGEGERVMDLTELPALVKASLSNEIPH